MTPTLRVRPIRGLAVALVVALVGVIALDVTSIVTAPTTSSASAAPVQPIKSQFRMLKWAGRTWIVVPHSQPGPDNDEMSDSQAAVHVDSHGRLHLTMTKSKGAWQSVELIGAQPVNYGKYSFAVNASIATLAKPLDLGMFIIRPGAPTLTNEVDLEDSRVLVGMHHGLDAQYVVQPYNKPHHIYRYAISKSVKTTQQSFDWIKNDVKFQTLKGAGSHAPKLTSFHYHGPSSPTQSNMSLRINLFIHGTKKYVGSGPRSVIINSFTYTPAG